VSPATQTETGALLVRELATTAAFRTALRRFRNSVEAKTSEVGLTPQRYDLLLMIKTATNAREEATVGKLCESLDLKQPAVTELVKRAEQAGLIERTRSASDRRVFPLRLTRDGEQRLMRAFRALSDDRAAFAEAFQKLDASFQASTSTHVPAPSGTP
jgi:DNA-binding MarR family transcriptional regulator